MSQHPPPPPTPPSGPDHPIHDPEFGEPTMQGLAEGPGGPVKARHPRGLATLFMTEMWERFSFYGMKALLVLYLVKIIAVTQLGPGVHSNTIEFEDKTNKQTQVFQHYAAIGAEPAPEPEREAATTALRVTPPASRVVRRIENTGEKAQQQWENVETTYTVENTSDKEIEYSVRVVREGENPLTLFTVNNANAAAVGTIKPGETKAFRIKANIEQSGLNWEKPKAGNLLAWYTGLVYLLPIVGGYIADRFLGTHRCLLIGGAIIAAGHFTLMFETISSLYAGLLLVIIGTGFFKSNVSTMVGQLYREGDPRRDAGFTIFYMGINLGAFIAPLFCGWLRVRYGWSWGFGAAGIGMVLGLIQYCIGRPRHLKGIGDPPQRRGSSKTDATSAPLTREEWSRIGVICIMAFFVIFFWAAFEQAAGSMAFFGEERTDRRLPSFLSFAADEHGEFPAEWFQSVNPLMILLLAPVFASLWVRLASRGKEPSSPAKMAIGLISLGLGFIFMVVGAQINADTGLKVSPLWLFAAFFVHTCAELCLSPVGLSMVSKLAPLKFASLMMGTWFLANFIANFIAGQMAGQVDRIAETGFILDGQAGFFLIFVIAPCAAGVALLFLVPMLKRMMHGRG